MLKLILHTLIVIPTDSVKPNQVGGKSHKHSIFTIRGLDNDNKRFNFFVTHDACPLWRTELMSIHYTS